jgi:hypothetical protein
MGPHKNRQKFLLGKTTSPSFSENGSFEKCNAIFVSGESVTRKRSVKHHPFFVPFSFKKLIKLEKL